MHSHSHDATGKILLFSLAATMIYIVLLVVYGLRAHSLALLSEAGHNFSDFLALLLSWVAVYFNPAQRRRRRPSDTSEQACWSHL